VQTPQVKQTFCSANWMSFRYGRCQSTINEESLEWLKFGKLGSQTFWWIKVWRIYHKINKMSHGLIVAKLADESLANFINFTNLPNFSHSKLSSFTVCITEVQKHDLYLFDCNNCFCNFWSRDHHSTLHDLNNC